MNLVTVPESQNKILGYSTINKNDMDTCFC